MTKRNRKKPAKTYEIVKSDGTKVYQELTKSQSLNIGFCGICDKHVSSLSEFNQYPMPGLCQPCRDKLEMIITHYGLMIIPIPEKGKM